jgi:hypothetical protein
VIIICSFFITGLERAITARRNDIRYIKNLKELLKGAFFIIFFAMFFEIGILGFILVKMGINSINNSANGFKNSNSLS